jgi:toxin ParE1/3/4
MEYLVRLTDRAFRDMRSIYEFIGAEQSEAALAWFKELTQATDTLKSYPERGTLIQRKENLRRLLFGKKPNIYRIIYVVERKNKLAHILHIRHGARSEETSLRD